MSDENPGQVAPSAEQPRDLAEAPEQTTTEPEVAEQAATETPEETTDAGSEETPPEGSEEEPERKRLSRSQRQQRKIARLSTILAEKQAQLDRFAQESAKSAPAEPKEADYNGDWAKYQADYAAYKATQNIRQTLDERDKRSILERTEEAKREATIDFLERVDEIKTRVADYDATIERFAAAGGKWSEHVIEEIRESDNGPMLAYYLAKNPAIAAELNSMSARDAAREIGRIETGISLPKARTQTNAPKPLAPLKGGASPGADPNKMSMSDYIKYRKSQADD